MNQVDIECGKVESEEFYIETYTAREKTCVKCQKINFLTENIFRNLP